MYRYTAFWPYGLGRKMVHLVLKGKECFIAIKKTDGEEKVEKHHLPHSARYFVETGDLNYRSIRAILARIHRCSSHQIEVWFQGEKIPVGMDQTLSPPHRDDITPPAHW